MVMVLNNFGVGGGGGGASDISLTSPVFSHSSYFINNIRDTNSLLSRIIVAGGGGSAGYDVVIMQLMVVLARYHRTK